MATPVTITYRDTHRIVPAKYAAQSVLENIHLELETIYRLSELDAAVNERKLAEAGNMPDIGPRELLFGVPEAAIINAALTHFGPHGGRVHRAGRNTWYAAALQRTAQAEVAFHRLRFLRNAELPEPITSEYQDFLFDFSGVFHQLEANEHAT